MKSTEPAINFEIEAIYMAEAAKECVEFIDSVHQKLFGCPSDDDEELSATFARINTGIEELMKAK